MRNVIVFALADGQLSDEEKQFIESLRAKLRIEREEFHRLCEQVRRDPRTVSLPLGGYEAQEAIRLLVQAAAADRQISKAERRLLRRAADYVQMDPSRLEEMIDRATGVAEIDDAALQARVDEMYAKFAQWDAAARRERIGAWGELGRAAVVPLLRVLESYRAPDGAADALALKVLVAEQLGQLGDERAAYYLAQQVSIGDIEEEISNSALRQAAAEALGRLVGQPFTRDAAGVAAAREWWKGPGNREYARLAF
jgi:hypothetical protein